MEMKKLASAVLALAMSLTLAVPVMAEGDGVPSVAEGLAPMQITLNQNGGSYDIPGDLVDTFAVDTVTRVRYMEDSYDDEPAEETMEFGYYFAINDSTTFTVMHNGAKGDHTYIDVKLYCYGKDGDSYRWNDWPHGYWLTKSGKFCHDILDPYGVDAAGESYNGCLELAPGESFTFRLPDWAADQFCELYFYIDYPDYQYHYWRYLNFKQDKVNAAKKVNAAYTSTQNVLVDGVPVEFQCYALKDKNGYMTNYVKLRDVAFVLNGTAAQFNVGWNGAVNIETGTAYVANGSEMNTPFFGDRRYTNATSATTVNGKKVDLEAILLKDDDGAGYTYYKLRDLGDTLGFIVDWNQKDGIILNTK